MWPKIFSWPSPQSKHGLSGYTCLVLTRLDLKQFSTFVESLFQYHAGHQYCKYLLSSLRIYCHSLYACFHHLKPNQSILYSRQFFSLSTQSSSHICPTIIWISQQPPPVSGSHGIFNTYQITQWSSMSQWIFIYKWPSPVSGIQQPTTSARLRRRPASAHLRRRLVFIICQYSLRHQSVGSLRSEQPP